MIERYRTEDLPELLQLFYDTVHTVNARDYAPGQLDAWAPAVPDLSRWEESLVRHYAVVARVGGVAAGFGDIDPDTGYLDRLYVHHAFQRQGIASEIAGALEAYIRENTTLQTITTEASITARPFFESRGYQVIREQKKPLRGELFVNYIMEKSLEISE